MLWLLLSLAVPGHLLCVYYCNFDEQTNKQDNTVAYLKNVWRIFDAICIGIVLYNGGGCRLKKLELLKADDDIIPVFAIII